MGKAFKEGGWNLLKDIAVHDPLYAAMLYAGLQLTSVTAPVLAALSFGVAVFRSTLLCA